MSRLSRSRLATNRRALEALGWLGERFRCLGISPEMIENTFGGKLINPDAAVPSGDGSKSNPNGRTLLRPAANDGDFKTLSNLRLFGPYVGVGFPVWFIISRDIQIRTAVNLGFERRR